MTLSAQTTSSGLAWSAKKQHSAGRTRRDSIPARFPAERSSTSAWQASIIFLFDLAYKAKHGLCANCKGEESACQCTSYERVRALWRLQQLNQRV